MEYFGTAPRRSERLLTAEGREDGMVSQRATSDGYDYEAVTGAPTDVAERHGRSGSRRALVMIAVGAAMAVCVVAAIGHSEDGNPLALGIQKLVLGGQQITKKARQIFLQQHSTEGLEIGTSPGKKVKYFNLDQDPAIGSQSNSWGYEGANGPEAWATVSPGFALCASGQVQSPVNILRDENKARLALPPIKWEGYEAEPFVQVGRETRAFFDGHSICLGGTEVRPGHPSGALNGPRMPVHGFSRYLPDLPLDKVPIVNYTLREIRMHTPAEHQIDGQSFPFEMQMVHECNAITVPPCPINKTMIVSVLFTEAKVGWGEKSPEFLTNLMDDLGLIDGVWNQYVESFAFDFGKIARALNMYTSRYFLMKGSLTVPPCTEDVTWYVLKDQLAISKADLQYAQKVQKKNARPLQPWNDRVIFNIN